MGDFFESASEGTLAALRDRWLVALARDDGQLAEFRRVAEGGAVPLDDLRRPDAFREHNGRNRGDKKERSRVERERAVLQRKAGEAPGIPSFGGCATKADAGSVNGAVFSDPMDF